jgi:FixJ family two-component response regulator
MVRVRRSCAALSPSPSAAAVRGDRLQVSRCDKNNVFMGVVQGKRNKEIAFEIGTTERTVKAHWHNLMEAMQVRSLAALVSVAERLDLVSSTD